MIWIEEISRKWKRDGDWRIAPAGLAWIAEGHRIIVGDYASSGDGSSIGNYTRLGYCASIGSDTHIGEATSIGDGTRIGNCTRIGDGTSIGNCTRIGDGTSIGNDVNIGDHTQIGDLTHIGGTASIGNGASEVIDLGFADGFRKCIANVKGVAYIGAGCRWFTLAEAIKHWESHDKNRDLTLCLMQSAIHIACLKGWAFSVAEK